MEAYVKYNYFHMEQRPRFKPDPFKAENFYYNEEHDLHLSHGTKDARIGSGHMKTASGYVSENARYKMRSNDRLGLINNINLNYYTIISREKPKCKQSMLQVARPLLFPAFPWTNKP